MTGKPVVYCTHPLHPEAARLLDGRCELRVASALDFDTLAREGRDADIIIVRANLPPSMFTGVPRLRAAIRHGAGLDMVPLQAATAAGVLVANVPGVNAQSVAEHIFMVALMSARQIRSVDADLRGMGWNSGREHASRGFELSGRTLGLIGMGHVGRAAAAIGLGGFGMRVLAHSRTNSGFPLGVEPVALDEIFCCGDFVVVACPLDERTRGLANAQRLALMKPSAVLINVARGAIIDDAALIAALNEKRIAGAALDVFAEQPLPPDHPFFSCDNVILTPHMAGITDDSMQRMGIGSAEETIRVLSNDLPLNFVNPEVTEAYRRRFPA